MRKKLCPRLKCALFALVVACASVNAATISGFVREDGSKESMPFVSVYLEDLRLGAQTNMSGYYVITGVPPGDFTLVANLIGFTPHNKKIAVGDKDLVHNIILAEASLRVEGVTITAERVKAPSLEIVPSRLTLRGADLKAGPVFAEPDPVRTLQTLPGVLSLSDFNVGLYVRGGTPDQNLIRVDGADLYNVSHFFGLFSTFPSDAIKTTELLSGGYPAQYGGRLSSVLNIVTDEGNKKEFEGKGGVSLLSSRLTFEGPIGDNDSWLISGRRTYLEPILSIASRWNDGLNKFGYYFYDMQGKYHNVISHDDQLTLAFYLGDDYLRFDDYPAFVGKMQWGNRSVSATWTHIFASNVFSRYQFGASRFRSISTVGVEDLEFQEDNRLWDINGRVEVSWFVTDKHTIETGVDIKQHRMEYAFTMAEQEFINFSDKSNVYAGYLQDSYRPVPYLSLMPGIRVSSFRASGGSYVDYNPRFSARYQIADKTFFKASVGRYTQYLFRVSREMQGISFMSDLWFMSDSTAPPSHAVQYVGGFETVIGPGIDVTIEGYYKDYDKLGELDDTVDDASTTGDLLRRGDGRAYGVEFGLKKGSGKHTGWINYSVGWSIRNIDRINTDDDGVSQDYYPKFDRRNMLNVVYSYQLSKHWTLSSRYAFATGQGYTPWLGRYNLYDGALNMVMEQRLRAPLNSTRLPYYSRLDLGFRGKYKGWGITWMPFIDFINVLQRDNVYNRYWSEGDWEEREPGTEKNVPQLPFLFTFGVDVEF
jgi:outer membrane cobalamin receptor